MNKLLSLGLGLAVGAVVGAAAVVLFAPPSGAGPGRNLRGSYHHKPADAPPAAEGRRPELEAELMARPHLPGTITIAR